MKKLNITVNDTINMEIDMISRVIVITKYTEECVITVNYPENWAYSRALQHGMSLCESALNNSIK